MAILVRSLLDYFHENMYEQTVTHISVSYRILPVNYYYYLFIIVVYY